MNSVERCNTELEKQTKEVEKAKEQHEAIMEQLKPLQEARAAAVVRFSKGEIAESEVDKLEKDISPLSRKLEGLEQLKSEAEQKVAEATEALRLAKEKAEADKQDALAKYVSKCKAEEVEQIRSTLPERIRHITGLYVALCQALGELQIDGTQVHEANEALFHIRQSVNDAVKHTGLRTIPFPGYPGTPIQVFSMVPVNPYKPGETMVENLNYLAGERESAKRVEWVKAFEASYTEN